MLILSLKVIALIQEKSVYNSKEIKASGEERKKILLKKNYYLVRMGKYNYSQIVFWIKRFDLLEDKKKTIILMEEP